MNSGVDALAAKKRWFQVFPEGSIEFLIVTRVGIVGLLLALLVIKESQRDLVWLVLGGFLWMDHVVILGWLLPMAGDVCRAGRDEANAGRCRGAVEGALLLACLASTSMLAIVLPWQELLRFFPALTARRAMIGWAGAGLGAAVFAVAVAACRAHLAELGLAGGLWRMLIHVPGLHWPAVHRYARLLARRMRGSASSGGASPDEGGEDAVLTASNVIWGLCMLLWVAHGCLAATRGWPRGFPQLLVPLAGALTGAILAVVQLAALERVQRIYLRWLNGR